MVERRRVPEFSLPASTGQTLALDSFLGKVPMVFVFLTAESPSHRDLLIELNSRLREFGRQRTQVLVVMRLVARSAREIADRANLALPILADANGGLARGFGLDPSGGEAVALVADRTGSVVQTFDGLSDRDPGAIVDALLTAIGPDEPERHEVSDRREPPTDNEQEFLSRVAEEARVSIEEAPLLVTAVLAALAPSLDETSREIIDELLPEGVEFPEAPHNGDEDVEAVLLSALEESSIATGRPVEHARVVTEALSRRADADQLGRLRDSIDDEGVLALFESFRGEMTLDHQTMGSKQISSPD